MAKFGIDSNMVFDADGKSVAARLSDHDVSLDGLSSSLAEKAQQLLYGVSAENFLKQGVETDDTARLIRAIADGHAKSKPVILESGKTYNISGSLGVIDVSKTSLIGNGSVLQFSGVSSGYALKVVNSADYNSVYKGLKPAIKGVQIKGGLANAKLTCSGLFLGDNTYTNNANFSIENVAIEGFTNNVEFGNNAWRIQFIHFNSRWGKIVAPSGLVNMGENINFTNCMIADGGADLELGTGGFHFLHTSFDNVTIKATGDVQIHLSQCHLENPANPSSGYRYISIENDNASVFVNDSDIIFNSPTGGGTFNQALFYVVDTNTTAGLLLNNLKLFMNSNYQPYTNDNIASLVAGNGRVTFRGSLATWNNGFGYVIAKSLNAIFNGDFESNVTGWIFTSGGSGTFAVDATTKKVGASSGKMSAPAGVTTAIEQSFTCSPSQWLSCQLWNKRTVPTGGNVSFRIEFYNRDGVKISTISSYTATDTTADFSLYRALSIVPKGTSYGKLIVTALGWSGTNTDIWLDEVIINVV